jgi:predicted metal-dependent phosphoesterase TrpH
LRFKLDLHTHTDDDPADRIPYSTLALIDRASRLGYNALAITLHDKRLDPRPFAAYAAERGIVLVPGIERTVEGKHVLLVNFGPRAEKISTFREIAELRSREPGLVIAPHPFFPMGCALGQKLDRHRELFDAVEINAMYVRGINFNARAIHWAKLHGKALVGNGDVHRLSQLGTTYSVVDAEPTPESICAAIREGRVEVQSVPLSWARSARLMADLLGACLWTVASRHLSRLWRSGPVDPAQQEYE